MVDSLTGVGVAGLGLGSALLLWVAVVARAHWDRPGGEMFSAMAATAAVCSVAVAWVQFWPLGVDDPLASLPSGLFFVTFSVLWGAFAAQRTRMTWMTNRRAAGALLVIAPMIGASILLTRVVPEDPSGGERLAALAFELGVFVPAFFAQMTGIAIFVVGVALIARSALVHDHVDLGSTAVLLGGAVLGWVGQIIAASAADIYGDPTGVAVFGVETLALGVALWLSVERFGLFDKTLAASQFGRDTVVETMEDAVVVVDDADRVLDLNPAAVRLFAADAADVVGEPFEALAGESLDHVAGRDVVELESVGAVRAFEPTVSPIATDDGERVGRSIVLRDVTRRRTREQRLAVLNRVLRHNLRNELTVITGYSEMLTEPDADLAREEVGETILDQAEELVDIGEKARTIEQVLSESPAGPGPEPVERVVEAVVRRVAADYPAVSFRVDVPEGLTVAANPNVLEPVLENLVENGAEHNDAQDPSVVVRASDDDDGALTITVYDNGPGIPETEREVIRSGSVTPLEHGSGLGLWVAHWGTRRLGGDLSFAPTEPRGTVVTLRVPTRGPRPAVEGVADVGTPTPGS